MRNKEWRVYKNSKSVKLVNAIIEAEELEVKVSYTVDMLGDSVIVIKGSTEEVNVLNEVYEMVA